MSRNVSRRRIRLLYAAIVPSRKDRNDKEEKKAEICPVEVLEKLRAIDENSDLWKKEEEMVKFLAENEIRFVL